MPRNYWDDSRFQALADEGEYFATLYESSRVGVPVDLKSVVAGLKSVNDRIERLLEQDFPEAHEELRAEQLEEWKAKFAEQQADLQEIADRWRRSHA